MTEPIVSAEWLNKHINDDDFVILDASQKIVADNISIAGARYFDIKTEFSAESEIPNTFPSVEQFEVGCQNLGIDANSKIVVYDNKGVFSSPRVWWMFKTMGHQNVAVLDGGLPDWLANGFETETGFDSEFEQGDFKAKFNEVQVKDYDFVCANINDQKELLIDARSVGRFNGKTPEPREGLRSGYIPNSINIPYTEVLENGKFKSIEALNKVFADLKSEKKPFVFTCGSGITACIILLASELVMEHPSSVYDGSWTEFALKGGEYYHTKDSVDEYIKLATGYNGQELIDEMKNFLPTNATLLELGSGPGSDWKILNQNYDVIGSDYSTEFTARLKAKYAEGEFLELDATTIVTDKHFDGIYSNKVLQHLRDDQLVASIQRQTELLNSKGVVCHSFWKGEGSEIFKGMFVNYHTLSHLTNLFSEVFDILVSQEYKEFEDNDSILIIGKKK